MKQQYKYDMSLHDCRKFIREIFVKEQAEGVKATIFTRTESDGYTEHVYVQINNLYVFPSTLDKIKTCTKMHVNHFCNWHGVLEIDFARRIKDLS